MKTENYLLFAYCLIISIHTAIIVLFVYLHARGGLRETDIQEFDILLILSLGLFFRTNFSTDQP